MCLYSLISNKDQSSLSSLEKKSFDELQGIILKVKYLSLGRQNVHVSTSFLWSSFDNELGVQGETEVVVTYRHFKVFDVNQINEGFGDGEAGDAVGLEFVGPWNNHIKSVVEELGNSFIGVRSLQIVNDIGDYFGFGHFYGEPLGFQVHSLEPHIKVNL